MSDKADRMLERHKKVLEAGGREMWRHPLTEVVLALVAAKAPIDAAALIAALEAIEPIGLMSKLASEEAIARLRKAVG